MKSEKKLNRIDTENEMYIVGEQSIVDLLGYDPDKCTHGYVSATYCPTCLEALLSIALDKIIDLQNPPVPNTDPEENQTRPLFRVRRKKDGKYYSSKSQGGVVTPWNNQGRFYTEYGLRAVLAHMKKAKGLEIEHWTGVYSHTEDK